MVDCHQPEHLEHLIILVSSRNMFFFSWVAIIFLCSFYSHSYDLQLHEQWWQEHSGKPYYWPDLNKWLYDYRAFSRVRMRNHVREKKYSTILDGAAGVGTEYIGFIKDAIDIDYQGIDITPKLVNFAQVHGVPVIQGSIEALPFSDCQFDLAYVRHALEHMRSYQMAMSELIRVARYEVMIIFFLPFSLDNEERLKALFYNGTLVYHHFYSKKKMSDWIVQHQRVSAIVWENCMGTETILHIYLKPS